MADERKPVISSVWTVGVTPSAKPSAGRTATGSAGRTDRPFREPAKAAPVKDAPVKKPAPTTAASDDDESWFDRKPASAPVSRRESKSIRADRLSKTVPDRDPSYEPEHAAEPVQAHKPPYSKPADTEADAERERRRAEAAARREAAKAEKERLRSEERAAAEAAAARAAALPCRNGYCGRVSKLSEMPEDSIPGRMTRWFTSLFAGDPYSPSQKGYSFFLIPDDPAQGTVAVSVLGDVHLVDGQHVCIKGRLQGRSNLMAQRIWWDTRAESRSFLDEDDKADWAPLADPRAKSAASLRILALLGIVLGFGLLTILINGVIAPLFGWLAVEGPELITTAILLLIGYFWLRNTFRRRRRW